MDILNNALWRLQILLYSFEKYSFLKNFGRQLTWLDSKSKSSRPCGGRNCLFSVFNLGLAAWSPPHQSVLHVSAGDLNRVYPQILRLPVPGFFFHHSPGAAVTPSSAVCSSTPVSLQVSVLLWKNHPPWLTLWLKAIKKIRNSPTDILFFYV